MRYFIFLTISIFISCNNLQNKQTDNAQENKPGITEFVFNKEIHNFGPLIAGETVIFNFTFTNTGDYNLVIDEIEKDCGCIDINFENEPIPPGGHGIVEIIFDTSGLFGKEYKIITLHANTAEKTKQLAVTAEIENKSLIFNNF